MLPTHLAMRHRHVGMLAADMSYGGSSQHDTIPTFPTKPVEHGSIQGKGPIGTDVMPCETGTCGCSMHGVSFISCICTTHPDNRSNLQTVKEDCYFPDKKLDQMTQSVKRCMIHCWYATNIYSICGKNKRLQLPDCLVSAVRWLFPEPDGN